VSPLFGVEPPQQFSVNAAYSNQSIPAQLRQNNHLSVMPVTFGGESGAIFFCFKGQMTMHFAASQQLCSALCALGSSIPTETNTFLFRSGDDVRGVYVVESGAVELSLFEGELRTFSGHCIPGGLLGIPASMTGSGYTLSAEVIEAGSVRFIPRAAFLEFLAQNPPHCLEVVEMLATEVSRARHQCA
jgi:hypothetical protein